MRKQPLERFIEKVTPEPNTGCWLWTGSERSTGYGCYAKDGKNYPAHRASFEFFKGPIPIGLEIDHTCRVPFCVNPDHLEAVTHVENLSRRIPRSQYVLLNKYEGPLHPNVVKTLLHNKRKTHCPKGHEYSGDNLNVRKCGRRECKQCKISRDRIRSASRSA